MWYQRAYKILVSLLCLNWIKMKWFLSFSELMFETWIQRCDKKTSFHFLSISRRRDYLNFYRLSDAKFYDRINTIYQFIKLFLDNKASILEKHGAFKQDFYVSRWRTESFNNITFIFVRLRQHEVPPNKIKTNPQECPHFAYKALCQI